MNVKFFKIFFVALAGGVFGAIFTASIFSDNLIGANLSEHSFSQKATSHNLATPLPTPDLGFWEKIAANLSPSLVGIQVFQNDKIVRQGSGIIVSSDGLIITTANLFIPNGIYQISYEDKILKGLVATSDFKLNLLLLKTSALNSSIADLDLSPNYQSGQDILLVGKLFDLSKSTLVSQRGTVSYVTDKNIVLDTMLSSYLYGFGVVDTEGRFKGITYIKNGKVNLIKAEPIDSFLKEYIEIISAKNN